MKFKILYLFILLLISNLSFGQFVQNKSFNAMLKTLLAHNVKEISAKEAIKESSAVFLDSRERREFEVSHIKNAIWSGYDDFNMNRLKGISKNQKIILYCSIGYRSEKITNKLLKAGYTDVSNLVGGLFEWKNLGYPVVDSNGKETDQIHAYSKVWGVWLNKGDKVYR
jgi:rhodanese-related sulfurtransferase